MNFSSEYNLTVFDYINAIEANKYVTLDNCMDQINYVRHEHILYLICAVCAVVMLLVYVWKCHELTKRIKVLENGSGR